MTAAWAPDAGLHGNGEDCPACALRRDQLREVRAMDQGVPCNFCGGSGRVGRAVHAIIAEAVAWARTEDWPARDAAFAASDARVGGNHPEVRDG
jgi:hypothetical protein